MFYIVEAKNGKKTCYFQQGNTIQYVYSKYNPSCLIEKIEIEKDKDTIVLLGGGLGYEIEAIRAITDKKIIVIEPVKQFRENLYESSLKNIEVYNKIPFNLLNESHQFILNERLINYNRDMYFKAIQYEKRKSVLLFKHPTISQDWKAALEAEGHLVCYVSPDVKLELIPFEKFDYILSVNLYTEIANLAKKLGIKYIAWTVDTPFYSAFELENANNEWCYSLYYDDRIVKQLSNAGAKNIDYLPVAADPVRMSKERFNETYKCEVSFLGHSCGHNEITNKIFPLIENEDLKVELNNFINNQFIDDQYLINHKEEGLEIYKKLIEKLNLNLDFGNNSLLTEEENVLFIIGRYHTLIERTKLVSLLGEKFNFKLYGGSDWLDQDIKDIDKYYKGNAEHYKEMVEIFKSSDININITRSFVESGLPMRVFDVLGSEGFLITNGKDDIFKYFIPDVDLVVYKDFSDLIYKINYYLENPELRKKIAESGFEKIKRHHTYIHRVLEMLEMADKYFNNKY